MGDGSRGCSSPRTRPVVAKVNLGRAEGLGALLARPVCVSVVLDAGTEMEVINGLDNGFW